MLRASGNMAFHTYWSISLFFAHFSGCNMASSRKPLYKKKPNGGHGGSTGLGLWQPKARTRPTRTIVRRFCTEKKKTRRWVRWRATSVGKRVKLSIPGKCRAGLLTGSCFYFAWILRRRNPKHHAHWQQITVDTLKLQTHWRSRIQATQKVGGCGDFQPKKD